MALWEWEACPSICPSGGGPALHKRGLCGGTVTSESGGEAGGGMEGKEVREGGKQEWEEFSLCYWPAILKKQSDVCTVQLHKMTLHTVHVEAEDQCVWSVPATQQILPSQAPRFEEHFTDTQTKLNLKHQILRLFGNFLWHHIWQDNTPSLHNFFAVNIKCVFIVCSNIC